MALSNRQRRIEDAIRDALARIFQSQVRDPRLPRIFTVTGVVAGKDLRDAKIHFSQLPDDEEAIDRTLEFLQGSAGFIRSLLAQEIDMRHCPKLTFAYDPGQKNFQDINRVLHQIEKQDKERAKKAPQPPAGEDA